MLISNDSLIKFTFYQKKKKKERGMRTNSIWPAWKQVKNYPEICQLSRKTLANKSNIGGARQLCVHQLIDSNFHSCDHQNQRVEHQCCILLLSKLMIRHCNA